MSPGKIRCQASVLLYSFEIRCSGREGTGRAFYCTVTDGQIVILHAMVKKSRKTSAHDLDIARKRLKEVRDAQQ